MTQRFGYDVSSIIYRYVFHDLYQNVLTELLHVTSDIHYLFLLDDDDDDDDATSIIACKTCNYYWTWSWSDPDDILMCRHCLCNIPKGVELNNKKFNPYLFQNE